MLFTYVQTTTDHTNQEAEVEIIKNRQQKALDEWAKLCEPMRHMQSYDRRDVNLAVKHLEYVRDNTLSKGQHDEVCELIAKLSD